MWRRGLFKNTCLVLTVVATEAVYLCSNALNDNIVELDDAGTCTCAPGYFRQMGANRDLSPADVKWSCDACRAGTFKSEPGFQHCRECESDYMFSAVGSAKCDQCDVTSMLTPRTLHKLCIPCPLDLATLVTYTNLRYIENTALTLTPTLFIMPNVNNINEFRKTFFINETLCSSAEMINNVGHLLKKRTVCPPGTHTLIDSITRSADDVDNVCVDCEAGKYSAMTDVKFCNNLTPCDNALHWDATGLAFAGVGRRLDTVCRYDWDAQRIQRGEYPRLSSNDSFAFESQRHVQVTDHYVLCEQHTSSTSTKCGLPVSAALAKCQHDFVGAWQSGVLTLSARSNIPCQYRCKTNFVLNNGQCTACVLGKYKNVFMSENEACELCVAGTHMPASTAPECTTCPEGTFSSDDRTECMPVCVAGEFYDVSHYCFRTTRSYLIILPLQKQNQRVNVQRCPDATDAAVFQQTRYAGYGVQYCRESKDCDRSEQWVDGHCAPCSPIDNSNSFDFNCIPRCNLGYFPAESNNVATVSAPTLYTCKQCEASLDVFQSQQCGAASYLADTCTVANANNQCLACSDLQREFQVHDTANVLTTAFKKEDRCRFKCREAEIVMGKVWYYLANVVVAEMMGITESQLQTILDADVDGERNDARCIRAEVHSKFNCVDDNLELLLAFQGVGRALQKWPTLRCRGAQRSCAQKNGLEVRVNHVQEIFECHCKAGYYGTYQQTGLDKVLLNCEFCPKYGDSVRGTSDVKGCFCRAGTFRNRNESLQLASGRLVCTACDSDTMYCPGGLDQHSIFSYISKTVALDQAVLLHNNTVEGAGKRMPCPANTTTRHRFANSAASCIANNDMRYDVALGYYVYCDDDRHSASDNITQWLEPKSQPCNRRCRPPFSILQADTGNCRCNFDKGYTMQTFADVAGTTERGRALCVCEAGWYQLDGKTECIPCPKNSHCDGRKRTPCLVQFTSLMFSKFETDCLCPPGFFFPAPSKTCQLCQKEHRCPGGRDTNMIRCEKEEICTTRGIYIPDTCPSGSTKTNVFRVGTDPSSCYNLGIVVSKTSPSPIIDVLYTNKVQKTINGQTTSYHVRNVKLADLCLDAEYQKGISRVLEQVAPMPMAGFFGAFQWLCGAGRVLVRNYPNVSGEDSLLNAFTCVDTPTGTESEQAKRSFLINSGLAVVAFQPMGHEGFLAESYHDARLSLMVSDSHLLWNVFLACDKIGADVAVSEIDTCTQCDININAGFLVLGVCLRSCLYTNTHTHTHIHTHDFPAVLLHCSETMFVFGDLGK